MNTLRKIIFIFSIDKKLKIYFLFFITTLVSILDLIGISAILPILIVFSDPEYFNNEIVKFFFKKFEFLNEQNFLFFSIILLFFIYVTKILLSAFLHILKYKTLWNYYNKINSHLMTNYLNVDYFKFLDLKIYEKTNIVKSEVENFIMSVIDPFFVLLLEGLTILLIFAFLIYYDSSSTLKIVIIISTLIIVLMYFFGNKLKKFGTLRHNLNNSLQQQINQGLHGIKSIKLSSNEKSFLKNYKTITNDMSKVMSSINIWQMLPRHVLEFLTIFSFILICYFGLNSGKNFSDLIILLALYAASVFRIMPSLNRVIVSYNSIRQSRTVIDKIFADFSLEKGKIKKDENNFLLKDINEIEIDKISFKFSSQQDFLIKDLSIKINAGEYIGILGKSGSGKTTFVDIFSGLLKPSSGKIKVNSMELTDEPSHWKSLISYMPQKIYLNNDTIKENIIFGNKYYEKKLIRCIEEAQLSDFLNALPQKIETIVGENGANFSGGQIQRLGIARALYRDSKILIFDESTSSLDAETEGGFMQTISKLKRYRTIIFISHKISLLKKCDKVYELKNKKLDLIKL